MEIQVASLREAMKLVKPVIPKKPTMVVVKNVLLADGKVTGTDLSNMIAVDLPAADRRCLLPHAEVLELLETVPGSLTVSVEQDVKKVKLDWGIGDAEYEVDYVDEYPRPPEFEPEVRGSVDGDLLLKALLSVVPFCSNEDSRASLTGVSMQITEDEVIVVGADGFKLGYRRLPIALGATQSVIIPVPCIKMLESLWKASPGKVHGGEDLMSHIIGKRMTYMTLNSGYFSTRFGRVTLVSKLIEGSFPNYEAILPTKENLPITIRFWAEDMERSLAGVKQMAHSNGDIIRLLWTDNELTIEAKNAEKGSTRRKIPVEVEGGDGRIALNITYLLKLLKGKDSQMVLETKDQSSPMQFTYRDDSPTVVMMPMKVNWGDEVVDETVNEGSEPIDEDSETIEDDSEETEGGDETAGEEGEIDQSLENAMDEAANEMERELDAAAEAAQAENEALVGEEEIPVGAAEDTGPKRGRKKKE